LEPELALRPEDVLGVEVAEFADAQPGVEQGPDDESLGGRLAGVGESVSFLDGEQLPDERVGHLFPGNCASLRLEHTVAALSVFQATLAR
jgi:hypothetical protein